MIEHLSALLLPIDALLSHGDFNPHANPSTDLVALFRNTWFLCVLFRFTSLDTPRDALTDWRRSALSRIATKTPPIVLEEAQDYASSALDFNSVIRHDYAVGVRLFSDGMKATDCVFPRPSRSIVSCCCDTCQSAPTRYGI